MKRSNVIKTLCAGLLSISPAAVLLCTCGQFSPLLAVAYWLGWLSAVPHLFPRFYGDFARIINTLTKAKSL